MGSKDAPHSPPGSPNASNALHSPPSYAHASGQIQRAASGPVYLSGQEHHHFLENEKGKKWLSMFVKSRASKPDSLPVFFEGDEIGGRVEIDLDKAEASKGVSIIIQGGTTFVGQDEEIFYKEEQVLWTSSKLSGKQSWPFKFTLPKEVSVKDGEQSTKATFRLPPSYTQRASAAYIDYKLAVVMKRGFMKVNKTLVTNFGYVPTTIPELPSPLRRLAYSEGSHLLGPDADPDGWKVLPSVKVKGTLFNAKEVEVDCTLAIATPLSYAVGSPIPLILTLVSSDASLLDLLVKPTTNALRVNLQRSMATGLEATKEDGARRTDNHFVENSSQAYFWLSESDEQAPNKKVLQGEVEVVRGLKPSFKFPGLTIRYSLDFMPFSAAGFTVPAEGTVLVSERVTIATRQILGLKPTSFAPPGYEKPDHVDYNKSVGLLENGNQRFLGHHHSSG